MASATMAPPARNPALLTKYDVAEQLGCNSETVIVWARKGRLKSTRPGLAYRFRQEWVDEFVAANESGPSEPATPKPTRNPKYSTSK